MKASNTRQQMNVPSKASRGGVPAYYTLYAALGQRIRNGELAPGDTFLSENEIATSYRVSRVTVRRALAMLEKDGLLIRRQGARTSVAELPQLRSEPVSEGPLDYLMTRGIAADTKNLDQGWRSAVPADVARALRLAKGEKVFYVCRLRHHEDAPFSYSQMYLTKAAADRLDLDALGNDPILVMLEQNGFAASSADQFLSATLAHDPVAEHLGVPISSALFEMRRIAFCADAKPILYQHSLYRPDKYEYYMRLSRDNASTRPRWRHI